MTAGTSPASVPAPKPPCQIGAAQLGFSNMGHPLFYLSSACRTFRKGGVITSLDEYTAVPSHTAAGLGPAAAPPSGPPARLGPQIQTSNTGHPILTCVPCVRAGLSEKVVSSLPWMNTPQSPAAQQRALGLQLYPPQGPLQDWGPRYRPAMWGTSC